LLGLGLQRRATRGRPRAIGRALESSIQQEPAMREFFRRFSSVASAAVGSFWAFLLAFVVVVAWGCTGPIFKYSDTWQLVMNTTSSIVTFLMVFLIQNTQNRDTVAIQLKLDELLRGVAGARTAMVDLEAMSDDELERLQREFRKLREKAALADRQASTQSDPDAQPGSD
jgi:low affinity Fe/Cu permease